MKGHLLILIALTALLTGCGEKFDASTDNLIRASYNGILKSLGGEEKEEFVRQYQLYTAPYELPIDPNDPGIDIAQNDIESLHGLSYGQVIDRVAKHEEFLETLQRDKDIQTLTELHKVFLDSRANIKQSMKELPVTLAPLGGDYMGVVAVKVELDNNASFAIEQFVLNVSITQRSTGEELFSDTKTADLSTDPLQPGYTYATSFGDQQIQEAFLNKNLSVQGYIYDVTTSDGRRVLSIMQDADYIQYASLQKTYPEEFMEIKEELGEPVI
ncbi:MULTISPECIES: DUF6694 family lipoprotein [Alcanivorax]|uniref:Uncharacterized protein n=1 Tax=Alcanivorax sediminis TaxID=2663008 RepID=A0A6N7LRM3_9GAMM|nr:MULTISPECIES: DUF6694 family lipoprotein [Alcanivorax]MQX52822.1 hypothetical protein [Alcanivorax sediminis]MZR63420.1 hypothetical protein [Alcanivorax sp. DP30]